LIDTLPDPINAVNLKPAYKMKKKVTFSPNIKPEEEIMIWTKEAVEFELSGTRDASMAGCLLLLLVIDRLNILGKCNTFRRENK